MFVAEVVCDLAGIFMKLCVAVGDKEEDLVIKVSFLTQSGTNVQFMEVISCGEVQLRMSSSSTSVLTLLVDLILDVLWVY